MEKATINRSKKDGRGIPTNDLIDISNGEKRGRKGEEEGGREKRAYTEGPGSAGAAPGFLYVNKA